MAMYDVPVNELIIRLAQELKKVESIKAPSWATFAKTGIAKERPPTDSDWWYFRAASVLRKIVVLGPIGVSKLRTKYGSRKNRGVAAEHFYKGSGNIIRKILQQLEKAGFAAKAEKNTARKGRVATPAGISFIEKVASQIAKEKGIVLPQKPKIEMKPAAAEKSAAKKPRVPKKKKAEFSESALNEAAGQAAQPAAHTAAETAQPEIVSETI